MKATIIYSIWLHHRLFHAFNVARRSSVQYKTELWVQNCHMKWADKEYRQSSIEETPRPNYRWNFIEILLKLDQKWKKKNQREGNRTYCIDERFRAIGSWDGWPGAEKWPRWRTDNGGKNSAGNLPNSWWTESVRWFLKRQHQAWVK